MKQVLGQKIYDTEKAEEIANFSNGLGVSDFRNLDESLYVTKNGDFFLAGEGGAMTKYKESAGNMSTGGSKITTLTKRDALYWCEDRKIDVETIKKYFGDLVEEA